MAMLDEFGPTAAEMRDTFETAAKGGAGYLLEIREMLDDPMLVTIYHTTSIADSEQDILKILTDRTQRATYAEIALTGVFDLAKSYDVQKSIPGDVRIKSILSPETQAGLRDMNDAIQLRRAQRDWAELPWHQRLLTPKPF